MPPAYISTAENDPLRDEGITYAQRLLQAGVSVELHQFPGTFHGSALVTSAAVSKRAQRESAWCCARPSASSGLSADRGGRSRPSEPLRRPLRWPRSRDRAAAPDNEKEIPPMADVLSEKARALIARPVLASLATLNPDGSPQITPLWVDLDGDDVVFNTAQGRKKARNLERDARVAVTVIDPDDPYNVVAFRGTVTDVTTDGADAHIDALAKKYLGVDTYPMRREGEVRIRVTVRTDHIAMQG